MQLSVRYRLYPSKEQEEKMSAYLELCRWLYNYFLGIVKCCVKVPNRKLLQEMIPALCRHKLELEQLHSKTRQYILYQLYSNIRALSELKKKGRKVGRLRFKGKGWFKTFVYNQSGFSIKYGVKQKRQMGMLHLSKIGEIPIRLHREVEGEVKQVTIKRSANGKWYAIVSYEYDHPINTEPLDGRKTVGVDVGIVNYAYDSDGKVTAHPHNIDRKLKRLKREQRRLSRKKKRSRNREKQKVKVATIHEDITNSRNDFLHKLSRYYVDNYDVICMEDLNIQGLMQGASNARNMADASWGRFGRMVKYKAETACKLQIQVPPQNTSQNCSRCGAKVPKTLAVRIHKCPHCGLKIDRDYNASLNIKRLALERIGWEPSEYTPVEMKPLPISDDGQASSMKQELLQPARGEAHTL